ncbi:MAG TPA: class I SAM-dependent methyltransferase [Streptosporangiaceae bacterium]|nr:class I SAM-dependent methyltransferase [Streptosporangiaceae bacterium]
MTPGRTKITVPDALADGSKLQGVSATALWTLRNRAVEASRPDALIEDPWAIRLYEAISYDWDKFGQPSQSHALRARAFDKAVSTYLKRHPVATVVALGEGLQTTYWRLGRKDADWITVDLDPVIDLRAELLPKEPGMSALRMSALDREWLDHVDADHGVFICAEGLFMYLSRAEIVALIADCAKRFPGGQMIFDSIHPEFSERTMQGVKMSDRYTMPPMPFSLTVSQALRLRHEIPGVIRARDVMMPPGRGRMWKLRSLRPYASSPWVRNERPSITLLTFAGRPAHESR